ncbi:MAG: hypothetical protein Q8P93_01860 [bacterium]|nr:hypothetical protein [bacterium]
MKQKTVVILLIVVVIIMGLFSFFKNKSSNSEPALSGRTIGDCVISETKRDSKVYDDSDAVCYIFEKLEGKDVTKEEIKQVIDLEAKFRESTTVDKSMISSGDPVPSYIFKNQTMNMSQAKIDRIYGAESYYLQFIGVIDKGAF